MSTVDNNPIGEFKRRNPEKAVKQKENKEKLVESIMWKLLNGEIANLDFIKPLLRKMTQKQLKQLL